MTMKADIQNRREYNIVNAEYAEVLSLLRYLPDCTCLGTEHSCRTGKRKDQLIARAHALANSLNTFLMASR